MAQQETTAEADQDPDAAGTRARRRGELRHSAPVRDLELGWGQKEPTIRLEDPPAVQEAQVDFGKIGFTATTCRAISVGPVVPAATLTISQTPGSYTFTMTNSLVSNVTYSGTIDPNTNKMTWSTVPSPYPDTGGHVTVTSVDMTITAKQAPEVANLDRSFQWTWAYSTASSVSCTGTTSYTG